MKPDWFHCCCPLSHPKKVITKIITSFPSCRQVCFQSPQSSIPSIITNTKWKYHRLKFLCCSRSHIFMFKEVSVNFNFQWTYIEPVSFFKRYFPISSPKANTKLYLNLEFTSYPSGYEMSLIKYLSSFLSWAYRAVTLKSWSSNLPVLPLHTLQMTAIQPPPQ